MWGTILKLGIPKVFDWLRGRQEGKKQERAIRAQWELTALKKSSTLLRVVSYITIWGPLYHAYYLAMTSAEINEPKDVATAIKEVFNAFPEWYIISAVSILLAIWGIKERDTGLVTRSIADKERNRMEAAKELQKRKSSAVGPTGGR